MQIPPNALTVALGGVGTCLVIALAVTGIAHRANAPQVCCAAVQDGPPPRALAAPPQPCDGSAGPTGELRLLGQAVDPDRHPVAGAAITLDHTQMTRAAVDGWFAFDHVAVGPHAVTGEEGERYGEVAVAKLDGASAPVELELAAGPTIVLHVVDSAGAPVAGATVGTAPWREELTNRDGEVRLRGVHTGYDSVDVTAPPYASVSVVVDTDDPRAVIERTVMIEPGSRIGGTVVDPDGHAAAGATVWIDTESGTWRDCVSADDAGVWHADGIAAGRHRVYATAAAFSDGPDLVFEHDGIHPHSGLALHLEKAARISGTVVDTSGAPVARANVNIGSAGSYYTFTSTDELGRFTVSEKPGRDYQVYATTSTAASPVVKVPPGDRGTHRLVLAPSSIAGTVVDTRGAPVEGARVAVSGKHDHYGSDTDARGRFEVGGVLPGAYQLTVVHGKHVHEPPPEMTVTAGDHGVAVVVPAVATLAGRVVAEGKPVPQFGIVVTTMAESIEGERPTVIHDAEGRFVVPGLDRGEDRVTIVAPGFVPRTVEHVELAAGTTSALGDIALDRGRAIAGRIVDEHGAPVVGATVTVYEKRERSSTDDGFLGMLAGTRSVRTGLGGRYRLEGIPPTQTAWRVEATHASGRASVDRALAIDETEVDLAVVPTGGIRGSLAQAARPSSRTLVIARSVSDPASYHEAEIHATGAFRFDRLPPGEYELDVPEAGGISHGSATVVAGARVRVVLATSQSR